MNSILQSPGLLRVRRNHGLEHATIHVLTEKNPRRSIAGHSDARGFWLFGNLTLEEARTAVEEALRRLRAGERELAVHPNCGTNTVVSGTAAGLFGAIAMSGTRRRSALLERLPLAILLSTLALVATKPLGLRLQEKVTTTGDPGNLEILEIRQSRRGNLLMHRVETRSS